MVITSFTKRKKIILISFLIGLCFFILEYFNLPFLLRFLVGFLVTLGGTCWALDFDLRPMEYLILPLIPILFYLSMLLSFPIAKILKVEWFVFPFLTVGIYFLLLTFNILNIATVKPLPLNRAAWISLSLWRFIIAFFVYTYLFWFKFDWSLITLFIFVFTILLTYPGVHLLIHQLGRGERSLFYILTVTLVITEIGFLLNFWKLPFFGAGLILASLLYVFAGIIESNLRAQLTDSFFWEYGIVIVFAVLLLFLL